MTATALAQTATSHADLLDKVYAFMTANADLVAAGEEWVSDLYTAGQEFIIHSPQAGDLEDIYIGWKIYENSSSDIYNIEIRGFGGYSAGFGWEEQPLAQPKSVYLCSYNQSQTYWIVASHRRFIVIDKVSTVYTSAYCGLFNAYATPVQNSYPMYVGASSGVADTRWSATTLIGHCARPVGDDDITTSGWLYDTAGWRAVRCSTGSNSSTAGTKATIIPFCYTNHRSDIKEDIDGNYTVDDAKIINNDNPAIMGILDGLGWVTGTGQTSESTLTYGGDTWIVIQNIFRTAVQDYFALRLV